MSFGGSFPILNLHAGQSELMEGWTDWWNHWTVSQDKWINPGIISYLFWMLPRTPPPTPPQSYFFDWGEWFLINLEFKLRQVSMWDKWLWLLSGLLYFCLQWIYLKIYQRLIVRSVQSFYTILAFLEERVVPDNSRWSQMNELWLGL